MRRDEARRYTHLTITAADGFALAAREFAPLETERGVVVIASAMGVAQDYYGNFAVWLANQGFRVLTFDYRGMGDSRRGSLRGFDATVLDWARLDGGAMLDAAAKRAAQPISETSAGSIADTKARPVIWLGHSLGGQILAFVPGHERVAKMLTVGTGSGYWLENQPALRRYSWWLWFVAVPVAMAVCGYFPGRRLRKVGDLPKGVMAQWRRWCLDPEYAFGAEGEAVQREYAAVKTPIVSLSFTDDEYMSERNTESIHAHYSNAPRTMRRIAPRDIGEKRIGHFGFFRRRYEETLWRGVLLPELEG
jgi:predicted alpha/beta hydrolase